MGWQTRGNENRYYYKSIRRGDKVVTRYEGSGEFARLVAEIDELEARLRRIDRLKRCLLIEEEREIVRYCRGVEAVFRASLTAAGYHQHARGAWRMKRTEGTEIQPVDGPREFTTEEVVDIANRAAKGDKSTLPEIQMLLNGPKRAVFLKHVGHPTFYLRREMLKVFGGKDLLIRAAVGERVEELEKELTPPDATPIERLLIERVATCWLAVHTDERLEVSNLRTEHTAQMREILQRRVERANARFLASVKALDTFQRLRGGSTTVSMSRTEKLTVKQDTP